MKIRAVTDFLDGFAPLAVQESYDNSGLIIGNYHDDITGIIICLDMIPEIIEEAKKKKCNLIISHHPLIFSPLKKITGSSRVEKTVIAAIQNNMAVYAAHTNLDNISGGINSAFADKLGLVNQRILSPRKGMLRKLVTFCPSAAAEDVRQAIFKAGAGHIGNYDSCSFNTEGTGSFKANDLANPFVGERNTLHFEPEIRIETVFPCYLESEIIKALLNAHPYEEVAYDIYTIENEYSRVGAGIIGELEKEMHLDDFISFVKQQIEVNHIRYSAGVSTSIKKVAVCGGSGSFLLHQSIKLGADAFITADVKYHDFQDVSDQIYLIDAGHYETEQHAKELLKNLLSDKFPNFAVFVSAYNTNPVCYL